MRALILNRFNLGSTLYRDWAEADVELVLLTSATGLSSDPATRALQLSGYARFEVFEDYDGNPEVEQFCISQFSPGEFDCLLAMSEMDILRAARIREALSIPGQSVASALGFRDKLEMKEYCQAEGVPTANFSPVPDVAKLNAFAKKNGYPIVVKPRREAGSIGVEILHSSEELATFVSQSKYFRSQSEADLIAEDFVPHQLYHLDGLVVNGKLAWSWTWRMSSTLGHLVNEPLRTIMLAPNDPMLNRSRELVRQVLAALPTPDLAIIHAELFDGPEHGLVFNEIASRVGGARVNATLRLAFGVGPIEWYIRQSLNSPQPLPAELPRALGGFSLPRPRKGILRKAPTVCPINGIEQYQLAADIGAHLGAAETSTDALASFVAMGETESQISTILDEADAWFSANVLIE